MRQLKLRSPFWVNGQDLSLEFDTFLGKGSYSAAILSGCEHYVAKFRCDTGREGWRPPVRSDALSRQKRVLEELYQENLKISISTYEGPPVILEHVNQQPQELIALNGSPVMLMRNCPKEVPTDNEIAETVIDIAVKNHRIVLDAHLPGNIIKLTQQVGALRKHQVICIDVGAAFKFGRDKSIPHLHSQDSLDSLNLDGDGHRIMYRQFFNDLLTTQFEYSNLLTQRTVKALIFLEENFHHFHGQIGQLKRNGNWVGVLSEAYHLYPYGYGLPKHLLVHQALTDNFISELQSENQARLKWLKDELYNQQLININNRQEERKVCSEAAYFLDLGARLGQKDFFVDTLFRLNKHNYGQFFRSSSKETKNFERVCHCFDSHGLLTSDNLYSVLRSFEALDFCVEILSLLYLEWSQSVAKFVLDHHKSLAPLLNYLKKHAYFNLPYVQKLVSDEKAYRILIGCFQVVKKYPALGGFLEKFHTHPSGIRECLNKITGIDCLGQDNYNSFLNFYGLGVGENVVRIIRADDIYLEMQLIMFEVGAKKVLSSESQKIFDHVQVFACKQLLADSKANGADGRLLFLTLARVLLGGKKPLATNAAAPNGVHFFPSVQNDLSKYLTQAQQLLRLDELGVISHDSIRGYEHFNKLYSEEKDSLSACKMV